MGCDSFAKKRVGRAQAGAVVKLRWQQNIARLVFLLKAAHGGDGDDPPNVERAQRINVPAMIQLVRQDPVAPAMPRQKINLPSADCAADQRVRGRAKRGIDFVLRRLAELLDLVQTASPDNADRR